MRINVNRLEEMGIEVHCDNVSIELIPSRGQDISGEVAEMFRMLDLDPREAIVAVAIDKVIDDVHNTAILNALVNASER